MALLDLLFPKKCVGCRKSGEYWCKTCISEARLLFPQVCPVCERNSLDGVKHAYCKKPFTPDGLFSIWEYKGSPKKIIQKIKYRFIFDAAVSIAIPVIHFLRKQKHLEDQFVLVPIPLYWQRKNWRGFNQTEEIGKLLAQGMGWKYVELLERTRKTESQVGKTEKERRANIEGVFKISPTLDTRSRRDRKIILFDDVWTTGSTMLEATKVLKQAGFKNVWCLTLAR